ncbi:MAG: DUF5615 family PIN-like protein [Herpetosiphonaceae bacterium]|nr:DUF5615 family PIN-like protein [Herpetosiphonaceae bacterium]
MRLLLDAHISGRRVAQALRDLGHDVRAADEERALDGMDDVDLLALAATDERIVVTFNVKDFLPIIRAWAEDNRSHAGCILIASSLRHHHFGLLIAGIHRLLVDLPEQAAWEDHVVWLAHPT